MAAIIIDISMDFRPGMAAYPGDKELKITEELSIEGGDKCNVSLLTFTSHAGTHIDAPRHFCKNGKTVDELTLDHFIGKAKVFEIRDRKAVTAEDLKKLPIERGDIILLKTDNVSWAKDTVFNKNHVYITPDAARYLAETGIKTLGFDYLSVEKYDEGEPETHYTLLEAGIVIIEGLYLNDAEPGEYMISALPVKIIGGNGSPVRAVLIKE